MHASLMDGIQDPWDQRYASTEQLWSGQPNTSLVTETRGLRPGRALDVGCGEGADALWLAAPGWDVTALDVSRVALDRAADQAERVGVQVRWLHAGLVEAALPPASFDLVSAQGHRPASATLDLTQPPPKPRLLPPAPPRSRGGSGVACARTHPR
jgi:SAM-dependent methyltransferase